VNRTAGYNDKLSILSIDCGARYKQRRLNPQQVERSYTPRKAGYPVRRRRWIMTELKCWITRFRGVTLRLAGDGNWFCELSK
jgi:hypothetical protein